MIAEALPPVVAGAGGAVFALAVREAVLAAPRLSEQLVFLARAVLRVGAEGRLPSQAERRRLGLVSGAVLGVAALLLLGPGPTALVAAAGPAVAGTLIGRGRERYRARVEEALPDVTEALADALASGGTLRRALMELDAGFEGPPAVELTRVRADLRVGQGPRGALGALAERVGSERLDFLVAAIAAQERTGGDLPALLREHARAVRAEHRVRREARAATAQARMTGGMVVAMPVAALLLVELAAGGFVASLLKDPVSVALLAVAGGLQLAGYVLIQRLGRPA